MPFSIAMKTSERSCCRLKRNKGLVASLCVMVLWGMLFALVKLGFKTFAIKEIGDILAFAGLRFVVCGAVITGFVALWQPAQFRGLKKGLWKVLLAGLFSVVLHYACTYVAQITAEASKTAILKQLGAIFYICFAVLFFPEDKLTWSKLAGLVLGALGILAINMDAGKLTFHLADLLIIGASFCTVFANVISKKAFQTVKPILLTGVSQLFGGVALMGIGLGAGGKLGNVLPGTGPELGIFGAIVAASVVSYCIWFITVQKENLSKLFIIKFSEPLFAAVFGWLLLDENIFQWKYLIAFLLICGGVVMANRKARKA